LSLASRIPEEYTRIDDSQLYAGIVDQLVQQQLLTDLVEEETTELRLAAENEHRALFATEAIQRIYEAGLTEDAIKEKYTTLYVYAEPIPEFSARHILVKTEDEAKEIAKQLEGGADFAELAKEKSTGPSGVQGGDLGWNGIGSLVPEFEAVMVKLDEGQISAPVKTSFGWHVIKLTGKRDQPVPELDLVRAEIEDAIKAGVLEKRISELETEGTIERNVDEIDPSIIRKFELLKD
jgi:peptidyl-prolyl cis-trans isomerase C